MSITTEFFDTFLLRGQIELIKIIKNNDQKVNFNNFKELKEIDITKNEVIGKFLTNNKDIANELKETEKIIKSYFKNRTKERPLNILLSSSPGSGKSFLLKQFKKSLKTEYKEFNLSTLLSKEGVFRIFQYIEEKNKKKITPIVFINEVDTIINNEYIFPFLLSAMSDGKSEYDEPIKCNRAIMVFAGSGLFESKETDYPNISGLVKFRGITSFLFTMLQYFIDIFIQNTYLKWKENKIKILKKNSHRINKFSDFLDRIDIFLILPPTYLKLENYSIEEELRELSVALINKHIKKISKIELHYLFVIMTLIITFESKREAESVIFLTSASNGNILRFENLPYSIKQKFKNKLTSFENRLISIITK